MKIYSGEMFISIKKALDIISDARLRFNACDIADTFSDNSDDNLRILWDKEVMCKEYGFDDDGNCIEYGRNYAVETSAFIDVLDTYFYCAGCDDLVSDYYFC